jgi:hypothetical protein
MWTHPKYLLTTSWCYIMYIMHPCSSSHINDFFLLKTHLYIHNFQGQKHVETKVVQMHIVKIDLTPSTIGVPKRGV